MAKATSRLAFPGQLSACREQIDSLSFLLAETMF